MRDGFPRAAAFDDDADADADDVDDADEVVETRARAAEAIDARGDGADGATSPADAATNSGGLSSPGVTTTGDLDDEAGRLAEDAPEPLETETGSEEGGPPDEAEAAATAAAADVPPPLTPADDSLRSDPYQSSDPYEIEVTSTLRDIVQADDELSPQARQVYVTTQNGVVELRGEVPTERERSLVEDRIRGVVGDRFDVSNLMTVRDRN